MVCRSGSQSRASSELLCFSSVTIGLIFVGLRGCSSPEPPLSSGALESVVVCDRAGRGVVDPVQDDEGHAADHDKEA